MPSTMDNILVAVKAVIDGLTLGLPCYIKKEALIGKNELPAILVAPGSPRRVSGQQFNDTVWYDYPVKIVVVEPGNMLINTNVDDLEPKSDAITKALFKGSLTGVTAVWDTDVEFGNTFSLKGLSLNYDQTDMTFHFITAEDRE